MKNKHTPEVRFAGFSGDWEERKLGDLAEFNPKSDLPEQFEYVDLESVVGINLVSHRTEQKETAPSRAQRLAKQGDVFFQTVRPYQKNNYLFNLPFDNYVFSTGYAQMRPYLDSYFLLSRLQEERFVSKVLDRSTGTSYPAINSNDLAQIEISIPSLKEEQTKIGNFFKQLDDMIALHQQELTTLKQTKQGFLQKMFPKGGESAPEVRFPGFAGDWEQRKLKDIVDLLKDGTHGTHKDGKDAFLLSAKNIKSGQIIIDELADRKISSDDYNLIFKNYNLMDQDLLITIVGTIGQTALYTETTSKLAFQRSVAIIRGNKDINQNFLKSTIDSNYVQKQLKQSASMSAQAGIYLGDLEKLIINIPKLSEQTKIGNFFKQLDDMIALQQRELDALTETKKAFLQKMFV